MELKTILMELRMMMKVHDFTGNIYIYLYQMDKTIFVK